MRLSEPRLKPQSDDELAPEVRERFGDQPMLNIFRTLAHHPDLLRRWLVFGNHILSKSTLSPRDREIAILRIGWLCQAEYEWGQHVLIAKRSDITDEEIERIGADRRFCRDRFLRIVFARRATPGWSGTRP